MFFLVDVSLSRKYSYLEVLSIFVQVFVSNSYHNIESTMRSFRWSSSAGFISLEELVILHGVVP